MKMSIKFELKSIITDAIKSFDYDDAIRSAIDDLDIESMVHKKLSEKIEEIDIGELIEDLVDDFITEQVENLDIEDEVLDALQNQFENL